jgi:hypothetical protein
MFKALILIMGVIAIPAAKAEQSTLTLACKGTKTRSLMPMPIEMGIIINWTTRTVQGFGLPETSIPAEIRSANDVIITFSGVISPGPLFDISVGGRINRVTGDMYATEALTDTEKHETVDTTTYELKCRPTERMF